MTTGQYLAYSQPSSVVQESGLTRISLATSGGSWASEDSAPTFFDGIVDRAGPLALAMLVLGRIATTRFYSPAGMTAAVLRAADPVFTSTPGGLRLESFSPCAGVYGRFDLDMASADVSAVSSGVTNVDFNSKMRSLLMGVAGGEPMKLKVATTGVTVQTLDGEVTEQKVKLPERWLRSFAESQALASGMSHRVLFEAEKFRRFVRGLPATTPLRNTAWVSSVPSGLRLATSRTAGSVGLAGAERLKIVEPLLAYADAIFAHTGETATSFWQINLPHGRFTLGLSPDKSRGFSGEGALLSALVGSRKEADSDRVEQLLHFDSHIDIEAIARSTGLSHDHTTDAVHVLAAQGLIGFDLNDRSWFHRPLPYDASLTEKLHPRLAAANNIAASVNRISETLFQVGEYRVTVGSLEAHPTCTCTWYLRHRGDRGPCKHVLAAQLWDRA